MKAKTFLALLVLAGVAITTTNPALANGRGDGPVVYVTSQGLYFDSIVVADPLPQKGYFQQLFPGPNGLETEFGPGDPGHRGGRWWIDLNNNAVQDSDDKYFLCPLLGPGRETP